MIQVVGTKKCKETMKALRFLKERGIEFQFVDLRQRSLSAGELKNIAAGMDPEDMVDTRSKRYRERGLEFMVYDVLAELEEDPELLVTPVIRTRKRAVLGFDPGVLEELIGENDA